MEIKSLLKQAREIWGEDYKMNLSEIIVVLGVVYGDICRYERNAKKDMDKHEISELRKELGNIMFSTIRWCDDLGLNPEECIKEAIETQKKYEK